MQLGKCGGHFSVAKINYSSHVFMRQYTGLPRERVRPGYSMLEFSSEFFEQPHERVRPFEIDPPDPPSRQPCRQYTVVQCMESYSDTSEIVAPTITAWNTKLSGVERSAVTYVEVWL